MTEPAWRSRAVRVLLSSIGVPLVLALAQIGPEPVRPASVAYAQAARPSDPDEAANLLFVKAVQLVEQAEAAADPGSRLALLQQAQANLDRIVQDYPGSHLAVLIIAGVPIGLFHRRDLSDEIAEIEAEAEAEAEIVRAYTGFDPNSEPWCEEHPDPCALFADAIATVNGIPRDRHRVVALSSVASIQSTVGLTEAARRAFTHAARMADETLGDGARGSAYMGIVEHQSAGGLIADAQAMAAAIDGEFRYAKALRYIAVALAMAGRTDEARLAFADAVDIALRASVREERRFRFLTDVAADQANAMLAQDAAETLSHLALLPIDPSTIDVVDLDFASHTETWAQIGRTAAEGGRLDLAQQAFADAFASARRIENEHSRGYAFGQVICVQVVAGLGADALSIAESIADEDLRRSARHAIVRGQLDAGLFDQALGTARMAFEGRSLAYHLMQIARAQAETGLIDDALETVAEADALSAAHDVDVGWLRAVVMSDIGRAEMAAGMTDLAQQRLSEAIIIAREVEGPHDAAQALYVIAKAEAAMGFAELAQARFDEAAAMARRIEDADDAVVMLRLIASAEDAAGFIEHARGRFVEAGERLPSIENEVLRQLAYYRVASEAAEAGYTDIVQRLFTDILEVAGHGRNDTDRSFDFSRIAGQQARAAAALLEAEQGSPEPRIEGNPCL